MMPSIINRGRRPIAMAKRNGLKSTLMLVGAGAGLMYLFDPQQGNRRRALLRDKMTALQNDAERLLDSRSNDLRNRARGLAAQAEARLAAEPVDDMTLAARV